MHVLHLDVTNDSHISDAVQYVRKYSRNEGTLYFHLHRNDFASQHSHFISINTGSYMSAHVLLNLLNELGKIDKMRGLPSILSLFRNEFNKFNNTRARLLDSIYHMTLRLL